MRTRTIAMAGALLSVGALAAPAGASAHLETAVSSVRAHTHRADAALEHAVKMFERGRDHRAARSLRKNRSETGRATAEAAKLLRHAGTPAEVRAAARAFRLVATQKDENVDELVSVLDEADGRVENKVAKAALADTRGREKALSILSTLVTEGLVPDQAKAGLAKAIAALSRDRSDEVEAEADALVSDDVTLRSKRIVAKAVDASLVGQAAAAAKLAELIASPDMPDAAKPGLQRALDAVTADHGDTADILTRFSDRMPASVRSFVEQLITIVREDARRMSTDRPAPPTGDGPPEGTPGSSHPSGPPF